MQFFGDSLFADTLQRLRHGDPEAVKAFVASYEPFIRRSISRRLKGTPYRVAADSVDVCQSALGSFLIRCAAGEFEFDSPVAMENLILTIAQRKLAQLLRHESAQCRDRRRTVSWQEGMDVPTDSASDPRAPVIAHDFLNQVEARLSAGERHLFQLRRQGLGWQAIAEQDGATAAMLKMRLSRALRRAAAELGLDDGDDVES